MATVQTQEMSEKSKVIFQHYIFGFCFFACWSFSDGYTFKGKGPFWCKITRFDATDGHEKGIALISGKLFLLCCRY